MSTEQQPLLKPSLRRSCKHSKEKIRFGIQTLQGPCEGGLDDEKGPCCSLPLIEATRTAQVADQILENEPCRALPLSRKSEHRGHVFEDSGLCAIAFARSLMVFTGDAMLPTQPWVKVDELRVSGCSRVPRLSCCEPRKELTTTRATKIGYLLVPVNSSRVILRPVFSRFVVFSATN